MRLVDGKLPAATQPPAVKTVRNIRTLQKTEKSTVKQVLDKPTTPGDAEKMPICKEEEKGSKWSSNIIITKTKRVVT